MQTLKYEKRALPVGPLQDKATEFGAVFQFKNFGEICITNKSGR